MLKYLSKGRYSNKVIAKNVTVVKMIINKEDWIKWLVGYQQWYDSYQESWDRMINRYSKWPPGSYFSSIEEMFWEVKLLPDSEIS